MTDKEEVDKLKSENLEEIVSYSDSLSLEKEFQKIIENFDYYHKNFPKKMKSLFRKGIPLPSLRKSIWIKLLGVDEFKKENPKLVYRTFLQEKETKYTEKILKDVTRTFPHYKFFRKNKNQITQKLNDGEKQLSNLLRAYAVYNQTIGYMQGMCFVAGFLLLHLSEEDSFWCFFQLMEVENFQLKRIFQEGLIKLKMIFFLIDNLLKLRDKKLWKYFQQITFLPEMYCCQQVMTVFTQFCQFETTTRIWDCFLLEGWSFIIRLIVGILKQLSEKIIGKTIVEIPKIVNDYTENMTPNTVVKLVRGIKFKKKRIKQLKEEWIQNLSVKEKYDYKDLVKKEKNNNSTKKTIINAFKFPIKLIKLRNVDSNKI